MSARHAKSRRRQARETKSSRPAPATDVLQEDPPGRARVLYIGDQGPVRSLVVSLLNVSGLGVVARSHGDRAISTAQEDSFDLIVLDVPGPGSGVLGTLSRMPDRPAPIITVSEGDDPAVIMKEAETGAIERVRKPVQATDLISTVDRILALSAEEQTSRQQMLKRGAGWYDALAQLTAQARAPGAPGEEIVAKRRWLSLR